MHAHAHDGLAHTTYGNTVLHPAACTAPMYTHLVLLQQLPKVLAPLFELQLEVLVLRVGLRGRCMGQRKQGVRMV